MRVLLLCHSFNSLAQRLHVDLRERGHDVAVELDIHDSVTEAAVSLFRPDLVIAPFLKRAIPENVWRRWRCLIVHPGVKGDRGPSALDWAILRGEREWGVTVLQANGVFDAGDIWAARRFPMRETTKGSLYRNEVTEAAVSCVLEAMEKISSYTAQPEPLDYSAAEVIGRPHPPLRKSDRAIDWTQQTANEILRRIRSADGAPGAAGQWFGEEFRFYDAHSEDRLRGEPGHIIAQRNGAVCVATADAALWIGHLRVNQGDGLPPLKLPAVTVLGEEKLAAVPELPLSSGHTYRDLWYEEQNRVGYLHFPFYNGAMSVEHCERLRRAIQQAKSRPTKVLVLLGGPEFWSNGIHLALIENAASPAEESWRNIQAMDDLVLEIIDAPQHMTISALQGNAGAGGVFLALAADHVWARSGVVLNPHYKGMGNLYGSEYWTYLLPRRTGTSKAMEVAQARLPVGATEALRWGLIDDHFEEKPESFVSAVKQRAEAVAADPALPRLLEEKRRRRKNDEAAKPLASYRTEELERMKLNFFGFDPSYHIARYNFIRHVPKSRTPSYLAVGHRVTSSQELGVGERPLREI
jgi:putative two-component system protein, hydrogenase maturation factor HypX/HoxX